MREAIYFNDKIIRNTRTCFALVHTPVEAAENITAPVFSAVEVHAQYGRKDEQHHGKVKHHHHSSLQNNQYYRPPESCCMGEKKVFDTHSDQLLSDFYGVPSDIFDYDYAAFSPKQETCVVFLAYSFCRAAAFHSIFTSQL